MHTGDVLGIGPRPAECLEILLASGALLVMGNHDAYFAFGPDATERDEQELAHKRWVAEQIDPALRSVVAAWPFEIEHQIGSTSLLFTHYARTPDGSFLPPNDHMGGEELDAMFEGVSADVVFFGHAHGETDQTGNRRYVNPGSAGCYDRAEARVVTIEETRDGRVEIRHLAALYDDTEVFADLESREVPAREFIRGAFLPRPD